MLFSLILPTYNESENIGYLIERIQTIRTQLPYDLILVVVDDNSRDGTAEVVKSLMNKYNNIRLIQRPNPSGLGSAYMDGFRYSLSNIGANFVGEMDADLQHPPETLVKMCEESNKGKDVVLASRYVGGGSAEGLSVSRKVVSKGANILTKIFLRLPVKDATSGFRIIRSRAARGLLDYKVSAKGYAFQVESLYIYKKLGMTFSEVPFSFEERKAGNTKLNSKEILRFVVTTIQTGIFGVKQSPDVPLRVSPFFP
jgi:dolichol-phosphate mannosyltransferase